MSPKGLRTSPISLKILLVLGEKGFGPFDIHIESLFSSSKNKIKTGVVAPALEPKYSTTIDQVSEGGQFQHAA
jgi:hypothetical protein